MSEVSKPTHRRWRLLRVSLTALAGLLLLAVVVGAWLINYPPSWLVKDLITRAVNEQTQQTLTIDGKVKLVLRPNVRLTLNDVTLDDKQKPTLVAPVMTADRVELDIKILDVWSRQFEVPRIVLTRPVMTLKPGTPLLVRVAEGEVDVGLPRTIEIKNGNIIVAGNPPQVPVSLEDVSAVITRDEQGNAVTFKGNLTAQGELLAFDGTMADLAALGEGKTSPLTLLLNHELLEVRLNGEMATQPVGQYNGKLNASTKALDALIKWSGIDIGSESLGQTATIEGNVVSSLRRITLDPAHVKLNESTATLTADLSLEEDRPALKANLTADSLDINKLLRIAAPPTALSASVAPEEPIISSAWDNLLEQLNRTQPSLSAVRAASTPAPSNWSTEPFTLTEMPPLDLDLLINAKTIAYGQLPLKNGTLGVKSGEHRMEVAIQKVELEDGKVNGRVELELEREALKTSVNLNFDKLKTDNLLAEIAGRRVLSGTGSGKVSLSGSGANMRALISSLDGTGTLSLKQGQLIGIDLRRAVLSLGAAQAYNPARRTDYNQIKGSFKVRGGILHTTEKLRLTGPQVDLTSSGWLGLVTQSVYQRINLSVKPPPLAFPVPLRMLGTISKPKINWDFFAAISNSSRYATPFSIAPETEKMPATTRSQIRNLLSRRSPSATTLSPDVRQFLEKLLETR